MTGEARGYVLSEHKAEVPPSVREGHAQLRQVLISGGIGAETAISVVENLSVTTAGRRVVGEPSDALLTRRRDDRLEFALVAVKSDAAESVRNETFDWKKGGRASVKSGDARKEIRDALR